MRDFYLTMREGREDHAQVVLMRVQLVKGECGNEVGVEANQTMNVIDGGKDHIHGQGRGLHPENRGGREVLHRTKKGIEGEVLRSDLPCWLPHVALSHLLVAKYSEIKDVDSIESILILDPSSYSRKAVRLSLSSRNSSNVSIGVLHWEGYVC